MHSLVLELTGKKEPKDGLEGKFSVYHGFCCGLIFGRAGEHEYDDAVVNREDMVALRRKVVATVDDNVAEESADVTVILKNGQREHVFVKHAIGSLERPLTDAMLEAKARDMGDSVIGKARMDDVLAACWALGDAKDVTAITRAACP